MYEVIFQEFIGKIMHLDNAHKLHVLINFRPQVRNVFLLCNPDTFHNVLDSITNSFEPIKTVMH